MGIGGWNAVVLVATFGLWLASGVEREKPVLAVASSRSHLGRLEGTVAADPKDASATQELAQAYINAQSPGLALSLVDRSPAGVRAEPQVEHVYARALLDQGRAVEALAVEREVLDRCAASDPTSCDAWLVASATRRADILQQLVELGIEDARAYPEASAVAYHNATREARLAVE